MGVMTSPEVVEIPAGITDLESFRRWTWSPKFPRRGRITYLRGRIRVDLSMEELFDHNLVKGEFAIVLGTLVRQLDLGYYFHDRTRLTHPAVDVGQEPDGMFVSYDAVRSGAARFVERRGRRVEVEGSPDVVLEVVSPSSVRKDNRVLPEVYWRAGVREYWRVDVRRSAPAFDLLRTGPEGFTRTRRQAGGWVRSHVFGRDFRLVRSADQLGLPRYTLGVRP
jgi:Uma2 family endonuclease